MGVNPALTMPKAGYTGGKGNEKIPPTDLGPNATAEDYLTAARAAEGQLRFLAGSRKIAGPNLDRFAQNPTWKAISDAQATLMNTGMKMKRQLARKPSRATSR